MPSNIANKTENTQRVLPTKTHVSVNYMDGDSYDNFDRLLTQADTLLDFMIGNDNTEGFSREQINNLLWIVSDRLKDMRHQFEAMPMRTIQ